MADSDLCSYLNLKGLDVEGLYRVSGSLREIKRWQMRFDLGEYPLSIPGSHIFPGAAAAYTVQRRTWISSRRRISTTSTSLHRCSKTGCAICPKKSFR
ncbi:MAG: hypothetical protein INR71_04010 [Terriglobus roseus]|nr:hypothetical protein [Terriglobus roseus]